MAVPADILEKRQSMSATQKKTGAARKSSAAKGKTHSSGSKKKTAPRKQKQTPIHREVGAVVCLLLATFSALGYFNIQAVFVTFLNQLERGILGYGFWLMPIGAAGGQHRAVSPFRAAGPAPADLYAVAAVGGGRLYPHRFVHGRLFLPSRCGANAVEFRHCHEVRWSAVGNAGNGVDPGV